MKLYLSTHRPKMYMSANLALVVIASFFLFGCKPTTTLSATPTTTSVTLTDTVLPTLAVINLPQPEQDCKQSIDWQGIKPGISTKLDVVSLLGEPEDKGSQRIGPNSFPFYTYKVDGGEIAGFAKNRVFFRADGVVDWIEVMVGDQDGSYHKVSEITAELGNILDAVYRNSNDPPYVEPGKSFDVQSGPDQLYLWSACGIAVDALPIKPINNDLSIQHPDHPRSTDKVSLNANSIILIKILFIPTSYQGFKDYYMYKPPYNYFIPGSDWNIYIKKIISTNQ